MPIPEPALRPHQRLVASPAPDDLLGGLQAGSSASLSLSASVRWCSYSLGRSLMWIKRYSSAHSRGYQRQRSRAAGAGGTLRGEGVRAFRAQRVNAQAPPGRAGTGIRAGLLRFSPVCVPQIPGPQSVTVIPRVQCVTLMFDPQRAGTGRAAAQPCRLRPAGVTQRRGGDYKSERTSQVPQ